MLEIPAQAKLSTAESQSGGSREKRVADPMAAQDSQYIGLMPPGIGQAAGKRQRGQHLTSGHADGKVPYIGGRQGQALQLMDPEEGRLGPPAP